MERYRTLLESVRVAVLVQSDGAVLFANPAALRLHGATTIEQLTVRAPLETGAASIVTLDGREISVEAVVARVDWDGRPATQIVLHDLSAEMRAEQVLGTAQGSIDAILDNLPYLVWLKDTESRFLAVNQPFASACGMRSPKDLVGLTDLDVWPRELADRYRADDAEVMRSGEKKLVEEPIVTAGRTSWFETFKTPVYDSEGRLVGTTGFARDVTERKRAHAAIEESERRQRALLSAVPDLLFRVRRDGAILDYGAPDDHDLLVPPEDFMGRRLSEVLPGEPARLHLENVAAALESGEPRRYEYMLTVGGEERTYEARMVKSGPDEVFSIIRNVTDKKRLEESSRLHEQRLQALIDGAPFGAHQYELSTDGGLVFIAGNRSAELITGALNSRFVGKSIARAFPGFYRPDLIEAYEQIALHGGTRKDSDVAYDDGVTRAAYELHAVQTGSGRMAVFFRDVTEAQRNEQERLLLEAQLQQAQKMEALGQLAGGVAHDFNNLLSVIITYSGFVLDELPKEGPLRADLLEVRNAGQRAVGLTRQLLAFSRRQIIEPKDVDVNEAVRTLAKMLRRLIGEHITLELETCSKRPVISVDPTQLDQALTNLAVNARDAMPAGGMLTIRTADVTLDTSYARKHLGVTPGDFVAVTLTDSGTGIPGEILSKIFEPFFTTKGIDRGTGLGLPMVYGAMKQNGGHVSVTSTVGTGSSFTLYFRAADPLSTTGPDSARRAAPRGTGEKVLVVEDEAAVRIAMARVLRRAGYAVIEAARGSEALAAFEAQGRDIALVISDVVMPGMSGFELADELVRLDPAVKILHCSGYTDEMLAVRRVLDSGRQWLSKPVEPDALLMKVREMLAS